MAKAEPTLVENLWEFAKQRLRTLELFPEYLKSINPLERYFFLVNSCPAICRMVVSRRAAHVDKGSRLPLGACDCGVLRMARGSSNFDAENYASIREPYAIQAAESDGRYCRGENVFPCFPGLLKPRS